MFQVSLKSLGKKLHPDSRKCFHGTKRKFGAPIWNLSTSKGSPFLAITIYFSHFKRWTTLINHNIQRIGEQLSMASSREKQRDDDRYLIKPFSHSKALLHKFDQYFLVDHHDNLDKFRASDLRYRVCSFEPSHLFVSNCSRQITKLWTATLTFNSRVSNPNIAKSQQPPL